MSSDLGHAVLEAIASLSNLAIACNPVRNLGEQFRERRTANRSRPPDHFGRVSPLDHRPVRRSERGATDDGDVASYRTCDFVF